MSQFHERLGRESFVSAASTRNPFRRTKHGAGRSKVPYLALHPMGFSVPASLRSQRWALTPPFHPYPALSETGPNQWLVANSPLAPQVMSSGRRKSGAVCFLWHCPSGCLTASPPAYIQKSLLPVTRHRALRCSDFPPPPRLPQEEAILRPSEIKRTIMPKLSLLKHRDRE